MKQKKIIFCVLYTIVFSFALPAVLFARAGGGENYIDAGGGNSGYETRSSQSRSQTYNSGSYVSRSPLGIIVAIVIIAAIGYAVRKGRQTVGSHISSNVAQEVNTGISNFSFSQGNPAIQEKLTALKQKDLGFDEQNFKDKATTAFYKVQMAWEKKDMEIARAYVSDSIMQRYTVQMQSLQEKHLTNKMDNIAVGSANIADVSADDHFDKITVQMNGSAADYTIDDATGKIVKGSQTPSHFTEYWTFIRSQSAKTQTDKSIKDSKCPSCGAALQVSATGKCNYCGSVVTSGEYDWILSEITQRSDWEKQHGSTFAGGVGGANIGQVVGNAVAGALVSGFLGGFRRRR